ncbi:MAG: putative cytosolic protein [Candidatus Saccharibacteria bacterium]|nr:putative cytosolic protein [Candidatus Saccharibacteria bacterium]
MYSNNPPTLADLLSGLGSIKRKVFVSYHHVDQSAVNVFRDVFSNTLQVFGDKSLNKPFNSNDTEYVYRKIRENHIHGSSITIVIIGNETWKRKYVDWELNATISKDHAVLGVMLPGITPTLYTDGTYKRLIPDRLFNNHQAGYAHLIEWPKTVNDLTVAIDTAINLSKTNSKFKDNSAPLMSRNR